MISKAQIKYIQALEQKKHRYAERKFIAEGVKVVDEMLNSPLQLHQLYATAEWIDAHQAYVNSHAEQVHEVSADELLKASFQRSPNQVLAVMHMPQQGDIAPVQNEVVLALDRINDPGNMGTILRIADWFGVSRVLYSANCVDPYNPKVVQSTMGSIARVQHAECDLAQLLQSNHTRVPVLAAVLNGQPIAQTSRLTEGIIVIGSESHGIEANLLQWCTQGITIPRIGHAESLNAAVATGIICSHLLSER
jgi:TrmH family RNA methyltransferase